MSKKEKVLTFLKYSLRNRDIFVENNEMASGENPPYMLIDEKGIETLLAKISSSGNNNNSSIVATTQLPQFRGRRRKNDLAFVENKNIRQSLQISKCLSPVSSKTLLNRIKKSF